MFDRINLATSPAYPQTVNIKEVRAPTDDSIKLLRELEEKIEKSFIESFRLPDNKLEGVVHKQFDVHSQSEVYLVIYKLNGVNRTVKIQVFVPLSRNDLLIKVYEEIGKDVAAYLMPYILIDIKK